MADRLHQQGHSPAVPEQEEQTSTWKFGHCSLATRQDRSEIKWTALALQYLTRHSCHAAQVRTRHSYLGLSTAPR